MSKASLDNRLKSLRVVDDYAMRGALFDEIFDSFSPTNLYRFCQRLDRGLTQQTVNARSIVHSLFVHWLETAAQWQNKFDDLPSTPLVAQLRLMSRHGATDAWKIFDPNDYVFPDDRRLTLGERRARARIPDPDLLEHFLYDPDRIVARHLLRNSRITHDHVIRMACRRPTTIDALTSIFESQKFGLSRSVMLAILQNPYAPYRVAFALAYLLSQTELDQLMKIESLSPNLKGMIGVLYRNRNDALSRRSSTFRKAMASEEG
ncbi:MAG: hypothetical protein ACPGQS_00430 [Bradymonadia bacterium]